MRVPRHASERAVQLPHHGGLPNHLAKAVAGLAAFVDRWFDHKRVRTDRNRLTTIDGDRPVDPRARDVNSDLEVGINDDATPIDPQGDRARGQVNEADVRSRAAEGDSDPVEVNDRVGKRARDKPDDGRFDRYSKLARTEDLFMKDLPRVPSGCVVPGRGLRPRGILKNRRKSADLNPIAWVEGACVDRSAVDQGRVPTAMQQPPPVVPHL
jgi:hypothetical protein